MKKFLILLILITTNLKADEVGYNLGAYTWHFIPAQDLVTSVNGSDQLSKIITHSLTYKRGKNRYYLIGGNDSMNSTMQGFFYNRIMFEQSVFEIGLLGGVYRGKLAAWENYEYDVAIYKSSTWYYTAVAGVAVNFTIYENPIFKISQTNIFSFITHHGIAFTFKY
jgi:hypothetical protein